MKRLIIIMCTVLSFIVAQDAAGFYKLSGLDVQYYMAARYDTPIMVSDIYGAGITLPISTIAAGEIFYAVRNGPLSEGALAAISVNLNVLLNEDGTGALAEGSAYPDQELIEGTCVSDILILPITDDLLYESNANLGLTNYGVNVAGMPGITAYGGQTFGGLGLSQSVVFDYFPMIPTHPSLCDGSGNCFDLVYPGGSMDGFYACVGGGGDPASCAAANLVVPAGAPMPGLQAGFWWKEGVNGPADITSIVPGNTDPQFYLEWHAIDGAAAESGLGDIIGEDEDGDGTDFDRILGLPYVTAAYFTPDCPVMSFNYPVFGGQPIVDALHDLVEAGVVETVAELFPGLCAAYGVEIAINQLCLGMGADEATCSYVASSFAATSGGDCDTALYMATQTGDGTLADTAADIAEAACVSEANGVANDAYVMDPSLAQWNGFLTYNAAAFQQCVPQAMGMGMDYASAMEYCGGMYGADDSAGDFDPSCLADGDDSDCGGRLVMHFDPTCVPEIEIREVCAEFIDIGGDGCGTGDMNADGANNVLDVVALVNVVLSGTGDGCLGDMNGDGAENVLDVVALVNLVLSGGGRVDGATSAEFNVIGNEVTMTADGYVGAVEMTLSHGNDFALTLTDNALVADYITDANTTRLMIVEPKDNSLFSANGDFTIESVIAASNGESYMQTSISMLNDYSISSAYPNPFNPTTQMTLDLNTDVNVSVKVFNTMGQLVDVIVDGQMTNGSYSITWDGTNAASGVYFIQTEIGSETHNQKIMLIK